MASKHRLQESVSNLVPLSQNTRKFDAIQRGEAIAVKSEIKDNRD